MLSEKALERADSTGNRSQYIEQLLMNAATRPLEVVPLQQLITLLDEKLKTQGRVIVKPADTYDTPTSTPLSKNVASAAPNRTTKSILDEITQLEAEREEKLEYNQDPTDINKIHKQYTDQIKLLWDEYHNLKKEEQ